ncbi:MAG: short chain amide porin, partial [Algoriphagus marincola HL-49]
MLLSMCGVLLFGMPTYAQKQTQEKVRPEKADQDFVDHTYKPLTLKLNDDGSKYIRFLLWNQMWARVIQNNPGTLDVAGSPQSTTTDIGIRRARVLAYAE